MPDQPVAPLPTSGSAAATAAANVPPSVYLSPQQQQALLASMNLDGWQVVGGAANPDTEIRFDAANRPHVVSKDTYTVLVRNPSDPYGKGESVTIRKGNPNQGEETWLPVSGAPAPKAKPTTLDRDSVLGGDKTGYYIYDQDTKQSKLIVPAYTPNADEEITKALTRENDEQLRRRRQTNEATTGIYGTDEEVAKIKNDASRLGLDRDTLNQRISEFNTKQKNDDAEQANRNKLATASITKSGAETGLIGAQTGATSATEAKTRQEIGFGEQEQPLKLEQAGATVEATKAQTAASKATQARNEQLLRQGNQPTLETPQTGMYIFKRDPNTGVTTTEVNPAYVPKTPAEIAARYGQLDATARAKMAEVEAKVRPDGSYTHDQALNEFKDWWGQNIQPSVGALDAAQNDYAQSQARENMVSRTGAYTAANAGGTQAREAIKDYAAMRPVKDPAAFAHVVSELAQGRVPSDLSGIMYDAPNPIEAAQQGTMNALKYIDPTAAAATGAPPPNYQAMDLSKLGYQNYTAPGVPGAPGATTADYRYSREGPTPPGAAFAGGAPAPAPVAAAAPPPPPPEAAPPPMLAAGQAGVPGVDPRFAGALDPRPDWLKQGLPPPAGPQSFTPPGGSSYSYGQNPWDYAPPYAAF